MGHGNRGKIASQVDKAHPKQEIKWGWWPKPMGPIQHFFLFLPSHPHDQSTICNCLRYMVLGHVDGWKEFFAQFLHTHWKNILIKSKLETSFQQAFYRLLTGF